MANLSHIPYMLNPTTQLAVLEIAGVHNPECCAAEENKSRGRPQECGSHQQGRELPPDHRPILPIAIPTGLTTDQQQQLKQLFLCRHTVFPQHEEDFGQMDLISHEIHIEGPPVQIPFRRQTYHIRQEED